MDHGPRLCRKQSGHSMRRALMPSVVTQATWWDSICVRTIFVLEIPESAWSRDETWNHWTVWKNGRLAANISNGLPISPPMMKPIFDRLITTDSSPEAFKRFEFNLYHGDLLEGGRGEILRPSGLMNDLLQTRQIPNVIYSIALSAMAEGT